MRFRKAILSDVFSILGLYHKAHIGHDDDPIFSDYRRLEATLEDPAGLWILTEVEGAIRGLVSFVVDHGDGLSKITRILVDPDLKDQRAVLANTIGYALERLREEFSEVDVVYATTTNMTMEQQQVTLDAGFKIFGVFPNMLGEDNSQLNGLTAYYRPAVLQMKRQKEFTVHHLIEPFFRIAQRQCSLPDIGIATPSEVEKIVESQAESMRVEAPGLEIIEAPRFVQKRYNDHRLRLTQAVNFYPFYTPDCLVMDALEEVEIFVKIFRRTNFAAIISEHLTRPMNPVSVYSAALSLLKTHGVSYIEIINDAADIFGTECILRAGFTPCAYFPAFRRQVDTRRDFVVFGKSFEYLCRPSLNAHRAYIDFYREYFRIEGKNYFPSFADPALLGSVMSQNSAGMISPG